MEFGPGWTRLWIRENGERIQGLRLERRISLRQLADESGVSVSQISRIERGRDARLSTLLKIFDGLGYRIEFKLRETCEEGGALLTEESERRKDRRHDGLLQGKRWR
jgi:transcriptional regulator with XRE-family HTH domain